MRHLILCAALACPGAALAVGDDDSSPPAPSPTSTHCTGGKVAVLTSTGVIKCVTPKHSSLSDDDRYQAARELAYAGRYDDALRVLAAMADQGSDRVLTYMGFVHRGMGETELGHAYYRQAIAANPDNLLARSYMGQGFVAEGKIDAARTQLSEIRARGGRGTWAEAALEIAIETGTLAGY